MSNHTPLSNEVIPENSEINLTEHHEHYAPYLEMPHHRKRTVSESERIACGPAFKGVVQSFCRNKGHGFILPDDGSEPVFLHISDIEGEWCPKEGDIVSFKKALIPPKRQKYQAVHVNIVQLRDGKHEHWVPRPPM